MQHFPKKKVLCFYYMQQKKCHCGDWERGSVNHAQLCKVSPCVKPHQGGKQKYSLVLRNGTTMSHSWPRGEKERGRGIFADGSLITTTQVKHKFYKSFIYTHTSATDLKLLWNLSWLIPIFVGFPHCTPLGTFLFRPPRRIRTR